MVSNIPANYGYWANNAMNEDFMYNAYANQTAPNAAVQTQQPQQPVQTTTQGQVNFQGGDTQPASGGSAGIGCLLLGGTGAAAGYYRANPLKDADHFKDSFIKTISKDADKVNKYAKYFDTKTKTFTKEAPNLFNKALKNFKWKQAGKWGAITAGALIAINWLFGKKQ